MHTQITVAELSSDERCFLADAARFLERPSFLTRVASLVGKPAEASGQELTDAIAKGTAPILVRLIDAIGARFQIVVTEKVAAQAVPVLGAAMGALINASFTDYFNRIARYHFGIVALERRYGQAVVDAAYLEALPEKVDGRQDSTERQ